MGILSSLKREEESIPEESFKQVCSEQLELSLELECRKI